MRIVMNAHPHPDPLPRGEGTAMPASGKFAQRGCNPRASSFYRVAHTNLTETEYTHDGRVFLPLLGERAGVRAGVLFPN